MTAGLGYPTNASEKNHQFRLLSHVTRMPLEDLRIRVYESRVMDGYSRIKVHES